MSRIVQKFGGTSLLDLSHITRAAERVASRWRAGTEVVVVVSAMGDRTDRLLSLGLEALSLRGGAGEGEQERGATAGRLEQSAAEFDVLLSAGEQESAAVMSLCLQGLGVSARSFLGWQIPVETFGKHGKARVGHLSVASLEQSLQARHVVVCAGFQGMMLGDGRISTLGRGGSDTSAVLLAAALKADLCEIYTDVEGIYTTDPRIVTSATKIDKIDFEEMLEMAALGARVLETRAAAAAMRFRVPLHVRSCFSDKQGTRVVDEDSLMEKRAVSAVAYSDRDAKIAVLGLDNKPGVAAQIFSQLAEKSVSVDMIVQGISLDEQKAHISFTVEKADLALALKTIEDIRPQICYDELRFDSHVIKVSIIGAGMNSYAGVAARMFQTLAEKGVNIQIIATSEVKISVLIASEYLELALRSLHSVFGLDAPSSEE